MGTYLSIGVNPPPVNTKIIVKRSSYDFDDGAKIVILSDEDASLDWHLMGLICEGFDLWSLV